MKENPILDQSDNTLVCHCAKVDKGTIFKAIRAGHSTFEQICGATGACPTENDCANNNPLGRCCRPEIMALLIDATKAKLLPHDCGCHKP